jgi:parallel beta-helix repeat protein
MTRRIALYVGVVAAVALGATAVLADTDVTPSVATVTCTKFVAPSGSDSASGSVTEPFRTVARLVDSLDSGQVGCLRGGTYDEDLSISQPGITLTAYQSEQATLVGRLWVKAGADGVTVSNLNLDGKNDALLPSPTVNADNVKFVGNDVTNEHTEICFIVGSSWGRAQNTLIQGNRIHDCGKLPSSNQDHGIYVSAADNTQIVDNVIVDNVDRGIQLYPDAQGTVIRHNIVDGNGEGIIFSGAGGVASNDTIVEQNVFSSSTIRADVESWYPSGNPVGTNNVVRNNCVVPGAGGGIDTSAGGFTAASNLVVSNVQYLSASTGDYRLAATSPCASFLIGSLAPAGPNGEPPLGGGTTSPPPPPPPPPSDFEPVVGARVKVTNTSSASYGAVGEITYVSNDGKRALLLMDGVYPKAVQVADIGPAS